MAEQLQAILALDIGQFSQALQQAASQVTQFAQGVAQAMAQASQGLQGLTQSLGTATQATQQTTQATQQAATVTAQYGTIINNTTTVIGSFNQASQAATHATSAFTVGLGVLGALGIAHTIEGMVGALKAFATEAVTVAVKIQSLEATFRVLSGSARGAQENFAFLRELAGRLGIDFLAAAQSFKGLEAATRGTALAGEQAKDIFTAFAGAARVMGLSGEELRHILIAVEQMISKGKVSAEELRRQMGNFLPGAFEIAARSIGLTTKELDEMLKTGQLLSEDFVPKFAAQVKKELGQGIPEAAATAQASFARFANNMRDVSVSVGDAILTILKPIIDTINLAADKSAQTAAKAAQARGRALGDQQDFPGATPQEVQRVQELGDKLAQLQRQARALEGTGAPILGLNSTQQQQLRDELTLIKDTIAKRKELEDTIRKGDFPGGGPVGEAPFARQAKAIEEDMKQLKQDLASIQVAARTFMPKEVLETARETLRAIDTYVAKISDTIAASPGLRKLLPPDIQEQVNAVKALRQTAVEKLDLEEKADEAAKQADKDAKTLARERERLEQKAHDKLIELGSNEFQSKLATLQQGFQAERQFLEDELADRKRTGADATQSAALESATRADILKREVAETLKLLDDEQTARDANLKKELTRQQSYADALAGLQAKSTKSVLDDFIAATNKKVDAARKFAKDETEALALENAGYAAIEEKKTEITATEVAKQQKVWDTLANSIQSSLTSAFEATLRGTQSIFESIKGLFIKLVAQLAAYALTHAVIIPALVQIFGGSGTTTSGGSSGAIVGELIKAAGFGDAGIAVAGGGSGGGELGLASNAVTTGSAVSGALGGPTTGSLASSVFKGTGLGQTVGNFAGATLYGGTQTAGLTTASLGGAEAAGEGASLGFGAGGGAVTTGSVTLGTAATGIGAGIAVGFAVDAILLQINKAIGLQGRASGALAGAGAGAAGGAVAGSIILPGIGTAIGAIVGTIAGAIAGALFGGGTNKPPEFGFYNAPLQKPGRAGLDVYGKIVETAPFGLSFGPGKHLGDIRPNDIAESLNQAVEQAFQSALGTASGFAPQLQKALVDPINAATQEIADGLKTKKFKGDDIQEQLDKFTKKELPDLLHNTLGKLIDAAKKLDPLVKGFSDFITSTQSVIDGLKKQQLQVAASIDATIKAINEGTFSPAQLFGQRQADLKALQAQFAAASPAGKLALTPQIQQAATDVFALGKQVFGSTDSTQVTNLQQQLNAELAKDTPNARSVTTLRGQLGEATADQAEAIGQLAALQKSLTGDLQAVKTGTATVFTDLEGALNEQITLANQQIDILTASLSDLGSIDTALQRGVVALDAMKNTVSVLQDPTLTQAQFSQAVLAQIDILLNIAGIGAAQLTELRRIAGGGSSPSGASGSPSGESFQHGTSYVPRNMLAFLHQGERVVPAQENHGDLRPIVIQVNGAGDPGRVAQEVAGRIERLSQFGSTTIATRR